MQPQLKTKTAVPWGIPATIWLASFSALAAGLRVDTVYLALAFILVATALLVTVMAFGSATAVMDVPIVSDPIPIRDRADPMSEREFFPKGAISFFLALIAFMGGTWLALYALMIHHGPNT